LHRRGLLSLDLDSGRIEERLARRHSESFLGLNDLFIAPGSTV
jgi:hypothetical protein